MKKKKSKLAYSHLKAKSILDELSAYGWHNKKAISYWILADQFAGSAQIA